jgi:lipopolysaccharide transport system ATP-binding protein
MNDIAVKVENIGKKYIIGHQAEGRQYVALRDVIAESMAKMGKRIVGKTFTDPTREEIWALKNVSFNVKKGERIGIIGRNGAGKSTLLKILSRITEPTTGRVSIKGRVASLLEVGTGFHPELTGRENIYLNGAVLGMRRTEINRCFDDIVSFAEVEKYLDTPVKRYSSGMYVRLAFAVAAHLEPEILIVDEVLAVGDAQFQKKCLGRMGEVAKQGRTVFFVSHNMGAIRNLCSRVLLIGEGKLINDSMVEQGIAEYLGQNINDGAVASESDIEKSLQGVILRENPFIRLKEIKVSDVNGNPQTTYYSDQEVVVSVTYECVQPVHDLRVVVNIVDENSVPILATQNVDDPRVITDHYSTKPGIYKASCVFPRNTFGEKRYYLAAHLIYPKIEHLRVDKILKFDVNYRGYNGVQYASFGNVYIRPQYEWLIEQQ